jgi:hypothetical protein
VSIHGRWTADSVEQLFTEVRENTRRIIDQRISAATWVADCVQLADAWYREHYDRVETDFHMGIIGPDGQPKKFDRSQWIAGEVRRRCLAQLDRETPVRKDGEI